MNEHLFIAMIKNHPVLYDRNRPDFRNPRKRAKAWNAISITFNLSVEDCMRTWRNIRERYAKELKLLKTTSSDESKWSLFDSLSFLQPYIKSRTNLFRLSNVQALNRTNEAMIIAMVKQYPELYDKYCEDFKDAKKKECAWNSISETLSMPVENCMRLWRNIRERYTKELKLIKTSGDIPEYISKWTLFRRLSFLEPYIKSRKVFTRLHSVNEKSVSLVDSAEDDNKFILNHEEVHKVEELTYNEEYEEIKEMEEPDRSLEPSPNHAAVAESAIPTYIVLPTSKEQEANQTIIQTAFGEAGHCLPQTNHHTTSDIAFGNYVGQYLSEIADIKKKNKLKINIIQLLHGDENPLFD